MKNSAPPHQVPPPFPPPSPPSRGSLPGVVACVLGVAGLFLAFLLACNSIKNKERKHVTGLLASVMFFQFLAALVRLRPVSFLPSVPPSFPPSFPFLSPSSVRQASSYAPSLPPSLPPSVSPCRVAWWLGCV